MKKFNPKGHVVRMTFNGVRFWAMYIDIDTQVLMKSIKELTALHIRLLRS